MPVAPPDPQLHVAAWQAVILGLVQGLGEFLPISSSGHLKLAQHFLGLPSSEGMFAFDVLLHAATLLALIAYFHQDLRQMFGAWGRSLAQLAKGQGWARATEEPQARWAWLVVVSMVPTAIIAMGLHKSVEPFFERSTLLVSLMLLIAGGFNYYSHRTLQAGRQGRAIEQMTWWDAIACGTVQGLAAVFHGLSRSGSTMATGLARGLGGEEAPRFSFLMAVPAVFGAIVVKLPDLAKSAEQGISVPSMLIGCLVAMVSGYWAVRTVFRTVREGKFLGFAIYCWVVGGLSLVLILAGVGG